MPARAVGSSATTVRRRLAGIDLIPANVETQSVAAGAQGGLLREGAALIRLALAGSRGSVLTLHGLGGIAQGGTVSREVLGLEP